MKKTNDIKETSILKRGFLNSAIIFTFITVIYTLIFCILNIKDDAQATIKAMQVIFFYPFSLSLAFANIVLNYSKLSKPLRVVFHYLIVMISFILFIYLHIVDKVEGKNIIVVTFVLSLIYAVVITVYLLIKDKLNPIKKRIKTTHLYIKKAKES